MESTPRIVSISQRLLQVGVLLLLLSRAWQYLYWGSPLRAVFWDEDLFSSFIERFGWTWSAWVGSPQAEQYVEHMTNALGIGFLIAAIGVPLFARRPKASRWLLVAGGLLCLLHALLDTKANFIRIGHFAELSLQWMSPLLLAYLAYANHATTRFLLWVKIAIALTFIGHGLYAWGYYPVPGHFQQMMISGFGVNNQQALFLLKLAGALDFIAALFLFIPNRKWALIGLYYIIVWGFLTALARIWSHLFLTTSQDILVYWLPEASLRTVHFLVPLALLYWWREKK